MDIFRFRVVRLFVVAMVVVGALGLSSSVGNQTASADDKISARELNFRNDMRKLWEDHITWTRQFIVSSLADLPDTSFAAQRLLDNQTDIGNAIKPYYGNAAGDQLTALLRDHILIAVDIVTAAKAGDTAAFNDAVARWYSNADD